MQISEPLISLIVTVYNREQHLAQTLDSLLRQTEENFELLIWDDGSTDTSVAIARDYVEKDNRLRFGQSQTNQGCTIAMRQAVAHTTAPFIGWVDSDDILAPTALATTSAILKKYQSVGLVYTQHENIDLTGNSQGIGKRSYIPYSRNRLLLDFMTFHFRLLRRSVYNQIDGINPKFSCAYDYDLCLRLSEVTDVYHIPEPLYGYRRHNQSISKQKRTEQIACSRRAVEQALVRRGLDDQYELTVEMNSSTFSLKKR